MISDINVYVNRDLCFACGICVDRCILDNLRLSVAPCRAACPIHMNCQGYVRLITQGKEKEAAEETRQYLPFPGILGRVCSHPCEEACEREKKDGAVHIRALKRYLSDFYPEIAGRVPLLPGDTGRKVAVIGAGPAGLMAAYELRSRGHRVMVYEKESEPGGMLRYGIPSFRLAPVEVDRAVKMLEEMGVIFRTSEAIGERLEFRWMESEYDAVILAIGAGEPIDLNLLSEKSDRIIAGLDFLRMAKAGQSPLLGKSVVVIGGGNTAVDAALTCRRMGVPEVSVVCLENRSKMPAFKTEIEEAVEENIDIEDGWGPRQIEAKNGFFELELGRCISLYDSQGRFSPILEEKYARKMQAETIISAIGQRVKTDGIPEELIDPSTRRLAGDPFSYLSLGSTKSFVCGDAMTGPNSVIHALASGREAATSVDLFLRGENLKWGRGFWNGPNIKEYEIDAERAQGGPRGTLERRLAIQKRLDLEVEKTLSPQAAKREAERCLSCGRAAEVNKTCWFCLPCEIECPAKALEIRIPYLVR